MTTTDMTQALDMTREQQAAVERICAQCGLFPLTARVLVSRGITSPQDVERFLAPDLERDWHDPAAIPGLLEVADKVEGVMRAGGRILVFGDFDVDGITATALSVRGLRALGADAVGLIPHRYDEGYALSQAAVARGMEQHPDLIVTVDCGISCGVEVASMLQDGIDVCITDHHEPGEHVPDGVPVADPKLDEECPSRDLAGAGVALKLVQVLGARFGKPGLWRELTDLACLGTVADLMPLNGENRALVADGLSRINNSPRVSLLALAAICGTTAEEISSTKLSFSLIPRINAAGRMGDATVALDLLLSDEREQAEKLAAELDRINIERRAAESELAELVEAALASEFDDEPVIVVCGEGWHEGVKGIVASRIARKYKRPAIIFSSEDGLARGSGRTYGGIDLFELAGSCSSLFDKFGGHKAAIGITLPADKVDQLRACLCERLEAMPARTGADELDVDTFARLEECTVASFEQLDLLQPFGNGNRAPLLAVRGVFLEGQGAVGKAGNHLRFFATDGAERVAGIYFNAEDLDKLLDCQAVCDVVFEPSVDEWQGRRSAKLMTQRIAVRDSHVPPAPLDGFVDELFEQYARICDTGDYAGIEEAENFNTKVAGVTFEGRQEVIATLAPGAELALRRDPSNEFDANAIAVQTPSGARIGFLNRHLAQHLAPAMDAGASYEATVAAITGGPANTPQDTAMGTSRDACAGTGPCLPADVADDVPPAGESERFLGVNIAVRRSGAGFASAADDLASVSPAADSVLADLRALPPDELDRTLKEALIGAHELHDAQKEALANLAAGRSTLAIMATGRGKSLVFHLHAARMALQSGTASVFVYPLRALVADQAYHLKDTFAKFGLGVEVLTGESDESERTRTFSALADGSVSVVLTTPEFLSIHAARFSATARIGFLVVDEAHHIGQSKAGNRPAYAQLAGALSALGNPLVLAVTATAGTQAVRAICDTLRIESLVVDPAVRANLSLDDRRDASKRESYVAALAADGAKCVVYVNSREQSMSLVRTLQKALPQLAPRITFYNAGLPAATRKVIEQAFRDGEFRVVVSTSAFGEGIDIPDIEHVVLYHLPFSEVEFNQMAGRAGRDGRAAQVHLVYGYADARINERILAAGAPPREQLVGLYRALSSQAAQAALAGADGFSVTNSELCAAVARAGAARMTESAVSAGISVFRELGFLETSGHGVARYIRMVEGPAHMELADSVRYREGTEELEEFARFKKWALGAGAQELLERFNRPILPEDTSGLAGL